MTNNEHDMVSDQDIGTDEEWQEAGLMSESEGDGEPVTDEGLLRDLNREMEKEGSA